MMDSFTRWPLRIGKPIIYAGSLLLMQRRAVTNADYPALEKVSESAIKEKQKFERLVVPKETLLEMFAVSLQFLLTKWRC